MRKIRSLCWKRLPWLALAAGMLIAPALVLADWGTPPEVRSRVLALPDGTPIKATNPLPVQVPAAFPVGMDLTKVSGQAVGANAGAATAGTLRTVTATDSLEIARLTSLLTAFSAPGAAAPALGLQLLGKDGANVRALVASAAGVLSVADSVSQGYLSNLVTAGATVVGWNQAGRVAVNPIAGQVGVAAGAGATGSTTQRVRLASDETLGGTIWTKGVAAGTSALQVGMVDSGGLLRSIDAQDLDSGAGEDWQLGTVCLLPSAGGAVLPNVGSGAVGTGTPRVTLASNDLLVTNSTTLAGGVAAGHYQADIVGPLGASAAGASVSVVQDTTGDWTVNTELASAAALADSFANPTAGQVGAMSMIWDAADGGGKWERMPGTAAAGIKAVVTGSVTADTELPAAAALTDSLSGFNVPGVGAFGMLWDATDGGGKWQRIPGTSANGLKAAVTGSVSATLAGNNTVDLNLLAGHAIDHNLANVGDGSQVVTEAARPNSYEACFNAVSGQPGNTYVLAARAGRKAAWVQVQADADGQVRVALAGTTGATCTVNGAGNVGRLLDAGGASTAGGYLEQADYAGALSVCATAGTVNVCWGEAY